MTNAVTLHLHDDIAVLEIDNPPVNALGAEVRLGIIEAMSNIGDEKNIKAIVLLCVGRTFIAGADIREFGKQVDGPTGFDVMNAIEKSEKPVIAAMHGTALGGGLELALACHYRVAAPGTRFGLPEVKLGLLPGGGGTQRLPRLIGVKPALELMLSGDMLPTSEALQYGLVDQILEGDLEAASIEFGRSLSNKGLGLKKVRDKSDKLQECGPDYFTSLKDRTSIAQRGFHAPEQIIRCVEAAVMMPFDAGLALEREAFIELRDGPQSAAQRYYFFAERDAGKVEGLADAITPRAVNSVGIIGAGTMGGGIAMNFLNIGIPVVLVETAQEALERGLKTIRSNYERSARKGKLTQSDIEDRMAMISPSLELAKLADCDLVIEAVFENMHIKKQVFSALDKVAKDGAILATNTSLLNVNEIAQSTQRPGDVIGLHFFSPANIMKLLEIVRGNATNDDVVVSAMSLAKKINKIPVLVGVCHGFVGNRMYGAMRDQALLLFQEGAKPWDIDRVFEEFGMPMGPFAMADLAGLDIGWSIEASQGEVLLRHRLCEMGRRGQKTGAGYYAYDPDTRARSVDPVIEQLVVEYAIKSGLEQRDIDDREILERCFYVLVNEGAKIIDEGIAQRASDIDVIWVNGYGWPVYRGGPMYWADSVGLPVIVESLQGYGPRLGADWKVASRLQKLAICGSFFTR